MYAVTVRDHMMIAHSLKGEVFGPAQQMHGATYVVDLEVKRPELDDDAIVVDIGKLTEVLKSILAHYSYKNLDELSEFHGANTTTEFLAYTIFKQFAEHVRAGDLGEAAKGIKTAKVTLNESHMASASYEGELK